MTATAVNRTAHPHGSLDNSPLLQLEHLDVRLSAQQGLVHAVSDVSLTLERGESVALVGESGCGKTMTALAILRLLPPSGKSTGAIVFRGADLTKITELELRRIRGGKIGIVFQDSMTALNPVLTIGRQVSEILETHRGYSHRAALSRACELLTEVGISDPERRLRQYPHQLSGGLRQRIAIAIALAPDPELLIADEPTTALDVTIQAQVLDVLHEQQRRRGMTLLLITHDLGVVAHTAGRVVVMYAGRVVEDGGVTQVLGDPRHPYTRGLLAAVPRLDGPIAAELVTIPGQPPPGWNLPPGCAFRERCPLAYAACESLPALQPVAPLHEVACWAAHASHSDR